jgi:hypothetical protein
MIGILSGVNIVLGLAVLLGVSKVFSGWQLTMSGLLGSSHEFGGGGLLFVLGLLLLVTGVVLTFMAAGRRIKS